MYLNARSATSQDWTIEYVLLVDIIGTVKLLPKSNRQQVYTEKTEKVHFRKEDEGKPLGEAYSFAFFIAFLERVYYTVCNLVLICGNT